MRPGAFRRYLDLHRPIFQKTAAYGHFGREDDDFTWERTDRADALRERRRPRGRCRLARGRVYTPCRSALSSKRLEAPGGCASPRPWVPATPAPVAWSTRWTTSPGSATPAKTKL